ncbi:MAG: VOC family protein [Dehalococcoidia bacterium]|nr:VOC family protein [Dehalococcoidia bacterium]MCA9825401.1 VOC family protein [Dehalococcoidia bacterium]MCA9845586.1 VOC family protein [Dehalococcoidia bacterium]MCA9852812.1 VOC family protein [Dehalococcoidia bacterium]
MKPHLTHLFMEVGTLVEARRFYVDLLGLELLEDRGVYIAVGGNGGFFLGIEETPTPEIAGPEITLRVDDVDKATTRLREAGVPILEEPADMPWGARHTWIADPDGRRMSIYSTGP